MAAMECWGQPQNVGRFQNPPATETAVAPLGGRKIMLPGLFLRALSIPMKWKKAIMHSFIWKEECRHQKKYLSVLWCTWVLSHWVLGFPTSRWWLKISLYYPGDRDNFTQRKWPLWKVSPQHFTSLRFLPSSHPATDSLEDVKCFALFYGTNIFSGLYGWGFHLSI